MTPWLPRFTRVAPVFALLLVTSIPASAAPPVYLRTIGSPGTGSGQFAGVVMGVTLGSSGDVFVVSTEPPRVTRFHPDGTFVAEWDPTAGLPAPYTQPQGIESDGAGTIYVDMKGQGYPSHIRVFDENGVLAGDFTGDLIGNTLVEPWGMGHAGTTGLIVADMGSRLWQLRNGQLTLLPNSAGCGPGQLESASGVAVVGGQLYETEYSERLQRLSSTGGFIAELGSTAGCGNIRAYPRFVAAYGTGSLIVLDMLTNVAEIVSTTGAVLDSWGGTGNGHGSFDGVTDAVMAPDGTLYVADGWNRRVEVYGSGPTAAVGASWGQLKIRYR